MLWFRVCHPHHHSTQTPPFNTNTTPLLSDHHYWNTVVWYSKQTVSPSSPPAAASTFTASGHAVAMVELCGFGQSGPAFANGLGSGSYSSEDLAHEIGRSVPGFHAGEMVSSWACLFAH